MYIRSVISPEITPANDALFQEYAVEAASWYSIPFPEQRTWNSNVEPIGPEGVDVLAPRYFNGRKMTIYGGSSEVQRGIMSKVMLGL